MSSQPTPRRHWTTADYVLKGVALAVIVAVVANLAHRRSLGEAAGAVILVVVALAVAITVRAKRRRDQVERVTGAMAGVLAHHVSVVRTRFTSGQLSELVAQYGTHVNDADPKMRDHMQHAMNLRLGDRAEVEWDHTKGRLRVRRLPPPPPEPELDHLSKRVRQIVELILGDEATARDPDYNAAGELLAFDVHYPPRAAAAVPEFRAKVDEVLVALSGTSWASSWQPANDLVHYHRRAPLPTYVPYPADQIDQAALPFGIAAGNRTISWDMETDAPHLLMAGRTGAGKSVLLRVFVVGAARRGFRIYLVDPKRVGMLGMKDCPGVVTLATTNETMAAAINAVYQEMESRYQRLEAGTITPDELEPILLVVDEFTELVTRMREAWKDAGKRGESPTVSQIRSLARLGREGRVHLLLAAQRPDVSLFGGGEARDNFGVKVALGGLTRFAEAMMETTTTVTSPVKGRAIVAIAGVDEETEVQTFFVGPDHQAILEAVGPHRAPAPARPRLSLLRPTDPDPTPPAGYSDLPLIGVPAERPAQDETAGQKERVTVECPDCDKTFTGPSEGRGNVFWQRKMHVGRYHKESHHEHTPSN